MAARGRGLDHDLRRRLETAWDAAWEAFLSNKVQVAEGRARVWLYLLPEALASADADALVTLADMAHIAGLVAGGVHERAEAELILRVGVCALRQHPADLLGKVGLANVDWHAERDHV